MHAHTLKLPTYACIMMKIFLEGVYLWIRYYMYTTGPYSYTNVNHIRLQKQRWPVHNNSMY